MIKNNWNAVLYEDKHNFVWQYGADVVQLLNPQSGEYILDLGCGTGQLTASIADTGADVMGIDSSDQMINKAKQNYPGLEFHVADGKNFQVNKSVDAVFSNAALHWIPEAAAVIACIYQALKPNGRFVAEFGGKGNIESIKSSLSQELTKIGIDRANTNNNWYFPSISEYATLLEQNGFSVTYIELCDRLTPLADGEEGLANWIRMFGGRFLEGLTPQEQITVITNVENKLRSKLYKNGIWNADYRRIRVLAVKDC
ncbi:MAG: methyltransferase domain-containing protein [Cyanobacteria bacterium P01_A01_bin.45]